MISRRSFRKNYSASGSGWGQVHGWEKTGRARLSQGKSKPRGQKQGSQGKEMKHIRKNDPGPLSLGVYVCVSVHVCVRARV